MISVKIKKKRSKQIRDKKISWIKRVKRMKRKNKRKERRTLNLRTRKRTSSRLLPTKNY